MRRFLFLWLALAVGFNVQSQQAGSLDLTFDVDGRVTWDIDSNEYAADVLMVENNKIVVLGSIKQSGNQNIILGRFLENGRVDSSFGVNGFTITDLGTNDYASKGKVQADGRIVVVGRTTYGTDGQWVMARYLPNGTIDSSFGVNGITLLDFGAGADGANNLDFLANGKIIVCGERRQAYAQVALARFNHDGTLDSTFGQNGTFIWSVLQPHTAATGVKELPDGRLLVRGSSETNNEAFDYLLMRFTADGIIDSSFGVDGIQIADFGFYSDDGPNAMVIDSLNRIVLAGACHPFMASSQGSMVRYSYDGVPDQSFGPDGKRLFAIPGYVSGYFSDMLLQPDGKIIVCGVGRNGFNYSFLVWRFTGNVDPDSTWNGNGRTYTAFSYSALAYGMDLQPDGRLVVVGEMKNGTTSDMALARYNTGLPFTCLTTIANLSTNQVVCAGSTVQFSVSSNTGNLQWQDSTANGWQNIAGATGATLQLNAVSAAMNGRAYRCKAIDACTVLSPPVYLQVFSTTTLATAQLCPGDTLHIANQHITTAGPHTITLQGANGCDSLVQLQVTYKSVPVVSVTSGPAQVCEGDNIQFYASSSTANLQWQDSTLTGWQNIAGATNATLPLNTVPFALNGHAYRCVATEVCSAVSAPVYLRVDSALSSSQKVHLCPGESLQFKGQTISAAGFYYDTLQAITGCDSVVTLQVFNENAPAVALASFPEVACPGSNVQLVAATTAANLQWQDSTAAGWQDIPGATDSILFINNVQSGLNGQAYRCRAANLCTATTAPVYVQVATTLLTNQTAHLCPGENVLFNGQTISVAGIYYDSLQSVYGCDSIIALEVINENAPSVTITPHSATICLGDSVVLAGAGGVQYQWSTGEVTSTITVLPNSSGPYVVTATASNNCSAADIAMVVVHIPPAFPVITRTADTLITTAGYSYQWFEQGNLLNGQTAQTYVLASDGNYQVQITDSNGCSSLSALYTVIGLGVANETPDTHCMVYPVPAAEGVMLVFDEVVTKNIEVLDLCGRIVEVWQQSGKQQMHSVRALPNGLYVLAESTTHKPLTKICVAH